LTEAAALALDHVGQRLERTLVGTGHGLAAATVVEQRVHGFLQHPLFVAHDDLGRLELQQTRQAVVAVDDSAVQIVQIGGGEATPIERHQRTQIRRQHGQDVHHHPLGLDAGLLERFHDLQALGVLLDLELGARHVVADLVDLDIQVHLFEQTLDAFGAHQGLEFITVLLLLGLEVVLGHDRELLQRRHARVDNHIGFEVQHALDIAQRHVEHQAQA